MRILCNLPLECFDDRAHLHGIELCTYGPADRMFVDGVHFPFDVVFDPSRGTWSELAAALPKGFVPDLVLCYWPDQEPLPAGLHECPVPVVGIVSDYNLTLPVLGWLQPCFDVLLCDRGGLDLFRALGYTDVRWFCQYTFKRSFHRLRPEVPRDLDLAFAGNLNPAVQRERAAWIGRLERLRHRGIAVEVRQGLFGEGYGRLLNRTRIGFNRSIRGEMNLRAFEVPACGALLLQERENLEVRDFFVPGEEVVLYGDDDFEPVVTSLLADPMRLARIAAAGHRRVQDYSLGRRLPMLCQLLEQRGPGRSRCGEADAALGRAAAMLTSWASGPAAVAAAVHACRLAPDSAAAHNVLALSDLRWRGAQAAAAAMLVLQRAVAMDPGYAPAAINLAELLASCGAWDRQQVAAAHAETALAHDGAADGCLGPVLPLGFGAAAVDWASALQDAVRKRDRCGLQQWFSTARQRWTAATQQPVDLTA